MKDHQIAEAVNQLRDIALQFHGTQQLRERIAHVVVPLLKAAELPQPYAGAITLLETIAEHGATAKFDDGRPTPNSLLCKHFAEQLRAVAISQSAPVRTNLKPMQSEEDQEAGIIRQWWFDCESHYIDVALDNGKYSIFFRDRATQGEGWLDQADEEKTEAAPVGAQDIKDMAQARRVITQLRAALAQRAGSAQHSATELAKAIWRDNYKNDVPHWEPLPDLMGILSQIDNMVCGMRRAAVDTFSQPDSERDAALVDAGILFDGMTLQQFVARELYEFQEATGCDTAEHFRQKSSQSSPAQGDAPVQSSSAVIGFPDPEAVFASFCEREGYPSDGDMDAALRKAFYEGTKLGHPVMQGDVLSQQAAALSDDEIQAIRDEVGKRYASAKALTNQATRELAYALLVAIRALNK